MSSGTEVIGQRCIEIGGLVWIAVRAYDDCDSVFVPKLLKIWSVGTMTVHLVGHHDVFLEQCFVEEEDCLERCLNLFHVFTARPYSDYPNI